jgi:phosphoribosylformylglycinamidine (FGAM) synthase-like enzyme
MPNTILSILQNIIQIPDLANKSLVYNQYDSQVQNNTLAINGDAALIRIPDSKKALAITTDCTPRYVEADPYLGAIQAVAESYRNISATGAKPLAITNCLNFGNPQKPEIMGQIVKAIQGITVACKELDYPVVSGNVSLYNETNGRAIYPTPAIGGVGLLTDYKLSCYAKFSQENHLIYVIGNNNGHIDCSLYQREILKQKGKNPPETNLAIEKKHSIFIRKLIADSLLSSCHDVSDGGLLVALFEMCSLQLGCQLNFDNIIHNQDIENILFGEDQSRYIFACSPKLESVILEQAKQQNINLTLVGKVIANNFIYYDQSVSIKQLQHFNQQVFSNYFA